MNNGSTNYVRLGATTALMMTAALLGVPALSQETGLTCSVEVQGEESKLACLNENGTPASFHFQAALQNRIYLEYGLTLLGCAVPKIDGDLSDAGDAVACVQNMFGLPPGELSRDDAHYISAAAGNAPSRERVLDYLATRGYHLDNAHGAFTLHSGLALFPRRSGLNPCVHSRCRSQVCIHYLSSAPPLTLALRRSDWRLRSWRRSFLGRWLPARRLWGGIQKTLSRW